MILTTLLATTVLLSPAHAATAQPETAKLIYVRASRRHNAWGGFAGMPGGSGISAEPNCRLLGNLFSLSPNKQVTLEEDTARHQHTLKERVSEVFRSEFMREVTGRVAAVRRLSNPKIADEDARTIYVLVHDCTLDVVGTGPAVMPIKGIGAFRANYEGKDVPWVLVLSDAGWGKIDGFVSNHSVKFHVPEDVLAHELTHGMTADLLTEKAVKASNGQKDSKEHDINKISDVSVAFWEGLAEGVEATVGETLKGAFAYPFSMDPGVYGFLLERQDPVRRNKFAFDAKTGLPKDGATLLKSEGFIASFVFRLLSRVPYTLQSGIVVRGWPFMELAKLILREQPTNSRELILAALKDEHAGRATTREFLSLSGLATYSDDALELHTRLINAQTKFHDISDKMHIAVDPEALAPEYERLKDEYEAMDKVWQKKSEELIREALEKPRDELL
jgi:hypothetical protein